MTSEEKSRRISEGKRRAWAQLTPEERKARTQHLQGIQSQPETRAKFSKAAKRRMSKPAEIERFKKVMAAARETPEYKAKIAANIAAGLYDTRKGKPVSAELAAKISAGLIAGNYRGERNKMSKPCVCLNTGVRYACIREAAELTGIPQSSISAVLNGHQNTAHGLRFAFVVKEEKRVKSAKRKSASRQFDGGIFNEQNGKEEN